MEVKAIDKKTLVDIREQVEDLLLKIESLELASDPEFVESMKRSEEQIKNRDFADWNELQNHPN